MITEVKDLRGCADLREALMVAEYSLATFRVGGVCVFKFLHRAGHTGMMLRRALRRHKAEGKLLFLIKGEHFCREDEATRYLIDRYPYVADDEHLGGEDPCVTVVCIR